uniref:Uncharacterized protein n=1 Tax=Anopheles atroparvus TaxID=41427 RepID=A0AAG5DF83_ANOAO
MYKVALPFPSVLPPLLLLPVLLLVQLLLALQLPPSVASSSAPPFSLSSSSSPASPSTAPTLASHEFSFLVLSQPAKFNAARAQRLRRSIRDQIKELDQSSPTHLSEQTCFVNMKEDPENC